MGTTLGMRGRDLRSFMQVARQFNVTILVRHTNDDSLKYIGEHGFYPKPAAVKAKTADVNPPGVTRLVNGSVSKLGSGFMWPCWQGTLRMLLFEIVQVGRIENRESV